MLALQNLTEEDLFGVIFTEFPDDRPFDDLRERLELEIFLAAQEIAESESNPEVKKLYDPENEETIVAISPMWIDIALRRNHRYPDTVRIEEFKRRFRHAH